MTKRASATAKTTRRWCAVAGVSDSASNGLWDVSDAMVATSECYLSKCWTLPQCLLCAMQGYLSRPHRDCREASYCGIGTINCDAVPSLPTSQKRDWHRLVMKLRREYSIKTDVRTFHDSIGVRTRQCVG
jgi:hypothetical protein